MTLSRENTSGQEFSKVRDHLKMRRESFEQIGEFGNELSTTAKTFQEHKELISMWDLEGDREIIKNYNLISDPEIKFYIRKLILAICRIQNNINH